MYTENGLLKRSFCIMSANFLKWKRDYRVWFVFALEGFWVIYSLSGLVRYTLSLKKTLTPYLLAFLFFDASIANGLLKVIVYFGLIVLVCNAPFCDSTLYYAMVRSKKKAWWLGNCLYIVVTSAVYLIFLSLVCAVVALPVATLKPFWGSVVQSLLVEDAEVLNSYLGNLVFSRNVIQILYPDSAQWMTFGIAWLSFSGMGLLIYAVNELSGTYMLGCMVASFFVLLDPVVRWISFKAHWLYYVSPVSWSSIEHWKLLGIDRPLDQGIVVFAGVLIIIILFVVTGIENKRKDVNAMNEY